MEELDKVRRAFQEMAGKVGPTVFLEAKVVFVDKDNHTADLETDEGLDLYDCRLRALPGSGRSIEVLPKLGSRVLVSKLDETEFYVMACDEIDSYRITAGETVLELDRQGIVINGGSLGGLVKLKKLQTELNKHKAILEAILQLVAGAAVPEPGNGSPSAFQTALKGVLTGKTAGDFSDIENEKVKHG